MRLIKNNYINKSGFTLIESIIFLIFSSIIIVLSINFVGYFILNISNQLDQVHRYIDMAIGFERLTNDLRNASVSKDSWKKLSDKEIIFSHQDKDYGWLIKQDKLLRYSGKFNIKNSSWSKRVISVVMQNITKLKFINKNKLDNYISGITIETQVNNRKKLKSFVALRIGSKL